MSMSPKIARPLYYAGAGLLLAGSLAATVLLSRSDEWHPIELVLLLGALALIGQHLQVVIRAQAVAATGLALMLAASLLGPAPAVAFGLAAMVYTSAVNRRKVDEWVANLSTFAAYPLSAAVVVRALVGDVHSPHNHVTRSVTFGLVIFVVSFFALILNFVLIAIHGRVFWGRRMGEQVQQLLLPVLPAELAAALLTVMAALAYTNFGLGWALASVLSICSSSYWS